MGKLRPYSTTKVPLDYHDEKRKGKWESAKMKSDTNEIKDFLAAHSGLVYAVTSDGWKNVDRENVYGCLVH